MRLTLLIIAAIALPGCEVAKPLKAVEAPAKSPAIERYESALAKIQATADATQTNTEATNAGIDELKSATKDIDAGVAEVLIRLDAIKGVMESPSVPVRQAAPQAPTPAPLKDSADRHTAGITFRGEKINVADWLSRRVQTFEIVGDVDTHLRYHGLAGDFSGLSRADKVKLHSVVHAIDDPPSRSVTRERTVVTATIPPASGCANGNCARPQATYQTRQRLFGRWR